MIIEFYLFPRGSGGHRQPLSNEQLKFATVNSTCTRDFNSCQFEQSSFTALHWIDEHSL